MSLIMRLATKAVRRASKKDPEAGNPDAVAAALQPDRGPAPPPRSLAERAQRIDVGGYPLLKIPPADGATGTHLLYLHGGAYVLPLAKVHWGILERLQRLSGTTLWVATYPLAPEHTVDEVYPYLDALTELLNRETRGERLVIAGDSAGGGLALLHAVRSRDAAARGDSVRQADALVLFSPWADVSTTHPRSRRLEQDDPMLFVDVLQRAATWWAGEDRQKDPKVSPRYADLAGLPPVTIFAGAQDLLVPDIRLLADKLEAAGNAGTYVERPDGFHVYVGATFTPEARTDLRRAARIVAR